MKKKNIRLSRKLNFKKESILSLSVEQQRQVNGGWWALSAFNNGTVCKSGYPSQPATPCVND